MIKPAPGDFAFATERLVATPWHDADIDGPLAETVIELLSPAVTRDLPADWQGEYSSVRAQQWIADRDRDGYVLLVVNRPVPRPVGLLFLSVGDSLAVRLGYLFRQEEWGKGLATELIRGLVERSGKLGIRSLLGGVTRSNLASRRLLEKCAFVRCQDDGTSAELVYGLELNR